MDFVTWLAALFLIHPSLASERAVVGSKAFTESTLLGEIASQVVEQSPNLEVTREFGIGSTGMVFEALKSGAIDVYPDYTGTLAETLLKQGKLKSVDEIREALLPLGLTISDPLGFNNTYALAVRDSFARNYGLRSVSDLVPISPRIRAAFSYEFMDRQDGYLGMIQRYQLKFEPEWVSRMEHSLVYRALSDNAVDLIEVYSTDANIEKFHLRLLKDDRNYFPSYQAVWVARKAFVETHPDAWKRLLKLEGRMNEVTMRNLNADADLRKESFEGIASRFLGKAPHSADWASDRTTQILQRTREHLCLVGIALVFSVLVGIPLGVVAAHSRLAGQGILLFSALIQTVPALALLCFLIPFLGVGAKPAYMALCLYSLLPVVLNTFTGIRNVDPKHVENAKAYGLSGWQILSRIILPLSSPSIVAGVKTATIVSIGTATLAALIGAGGYGALIISGLSLNNPQTILAGAVPAAAMALVANLIFDIFGRMLIPAGLR